MYYCSFINLKTDVQYQFVTSSYQAIIDLLNLYRSDTIEIEVIEEYNGNVLSFVYNGSFIDCILE